MMDDWDGTVETRGMKERMEECPICPSTETTKTKELTRSRPSSSVEVKDISLVDYVNVQHAVYLRKWR